MGHGQNPRTASQTNLHDWLDVATKGLTEHSKERVDREVTSHYRDAIEAERRDGRSKREAQAIALASLGDPKAARKLYRREFVTAWDVDQLKPPPKILFLSLYFVFSVMGVRIEYAFPFGIYYLFFCWAAGYQAPKLFENGRTTLAFVLRALGETYFFTSVALHLMGARPPLPYSFVWLPLLFLLAALRLWHLSGIFRKVAKSEMNSRPPRAV